MTTTNVPQKLVIFGNSAFAQIAKQYFTHDSNYVVVGFTVDQKYCDHSQFEGLPLVPFEELEQHFPPDEHSFFAACTYTELNRLRAKIARSAESRGYQLASYISSRAFVWRNVELGKHCFVFEDNVVQPYCRIGENVVLWSGNHIGHHSTVDDNCFFASHVVLSGFVNVGKNCFIGVNVTIANNLTIEDDCWFSPNCLVKRNVSRGSMFKAQDSSPASRTTYDFFSIAETNEAA